jgi:hypothetical protein
MLTGHSVASWHPPAAAVPALPALAPPLLEPAELLPLEPPFGVPALPLPPLELPAVPPPGAPSPLLVLPPLQPATAATPARQKTDSKPKRTMVRPTEQQPYLAQHQLFRAFA